MSGDDLTTGEKDLVEIFQEQYHLSEDEMKDVIAHLDLCEEAGTPIRWDLIYCIIYAQDGLADLPEEDTGDCKSTITDGFEDESKASWFSIYPDFDDCSSLITFLVDVDAVKIGKKSMVHRAINERSMVEDP